ncbi:Na+/H+ antiporter subunit E [Idiomarina xiamenensis]|uniref:Multisubunit Na+/H+ antiporter, MnhE subunit n=1 Tax=Idiomarina xiamenensis 10-D-4 TaxID=740709 RepID=K2L1D8_9GAMM|nr:Na+/H+ antiporter subunit E [Idiomarina xiamenensis]EKE83630.1 multisubunit Na+/H+ antiporter, MnhE subunit [Idiomarina xiamenensis 10-D-4]
MVISRQFGKLFPAPVLSLILLVIWALLFNSLDAGVLVLGAVFALLVPILLQPAKTDHPTIKKPFKAFLYVLQLFYDIVIANFKISVVIIGYRHRIKPALIEFPLTLKDELPVTILASTISLTPGTISAEITRGRKALLIHSLNVKDPEAMIKEIRERYEVKLQEIFGC